MGTQSGKWCVGGEWCCLCCWVARGANVMQLDGKQAEIDGASVKQQLKFEDEMELSQLEEERDHLMLLVEEMETASNAASTKDQAALMLKDKMDGLASAKKALDKMPSGPEKDEMKKAMAAGTKKAIATMPAGPEKDKLAKEVTRVKTQMEEA